MSSTIDFQLARLTAQSKGANPNEPGGGRPENPMDIVRLMAANIQSLPAYYAVMAKRCQDDVATKHLHDVALKISWREWRKNESKYQTRISVERLNRVTEAAVLMFLCPYQAKGVKRDDEWAAAYAKTTDAKWAKDFASHARMIVQRLAELESAGIREMAHFWRAWKREKSANGAENVDAA